MTEADAATLVKSDRGRATDDGFDALLRELARTPDVPAPPLAPGHRIGPFVIAGVLGRGGMGEVYAATDARLDRRVALKLIRRERTRDRGRRARFITEAKVAAQIHHPRVATVFEVGEVEGELFIAMELVEAKPLREQGPRSRAEKERLIEEIAEGLAAAHEKSVLHRDLKPDNILVGPDGVKIVDFGIASLLDDGDQSGELAGTPQYMSPEQLRAEALAPSSDVFAFGIVAYELLTGERPFSGETLHARAEDMKRARDFEAELASSASSEMAAMVAQCLAHAPQHRPRDGGAVLAALRERRRDLERSAQRQRRALAALPLLAALLVLAFVGFRLQGGQSDSPPSLASVPLITEDEYVQSRFRAGVEAFFSVDNPASARAFVSVLAERPKDPLTLAFILLTDGAAAAGVSEQELTARLTRELEGEASDEWVRIIATVVLNRFKTPGTRPSNITDDERAVLRSAFADDPDNGFARAVIATHYPWKESVTEQVELLDAVLAQEPRLALAHHRKVSVLARSNRGPEAEAAMRAALKLLPDHPGLTLLSIDILDEDLGHEETEALLKKVIRMQPSSATARVMLGLHQLEVGQVEAWRETNRRVLEMSPLPSAGVRALLHMMSGAIGEGYVDDATELYRRVLGPAEDASMIEDVAAFGDRLGAALLIAHEDERALDIAFAMRSLRDEGRLAAERMTADTDATRIEAVVLARRGELEGARSQLADLRARSLESFRPRLGKRAATAEVELEIALAEKRWDDARAAVKSLEAEVGNPFLESLKVKSRAAEIDLRAGARPPAEVLAPLRAQAEACLERTLVWERECRLWHAWRIREELKALGDDAPASEKERLEQELKTFLPGLGK